MKLGGTAKREWMACHSGDMSVLNDLIESYWGPGIQSGPHWSIGGTTGEELSSSSRSCVSVEWSLGDSFHASFGSSLSPVLATHSSTLRLQLLHYPAKWPPRRRRHDIVVSHPRPCSLPLGRPSPFPQPPPRMFSTETGESWSCGVQRTQPGCLRWMALSEAGRHEMKRGRDGCVGSTAALVTF